MDSANPAVAPLAPPSQPSRLRRMFFGPDGLRAGWSLLLFLVITQGFGFLIFWSIQRIADLPDNPEWTPGLIFVAELASFVLVLGASEALARIERRSLAVYGFPLRRAFSRWFWEGALWGVLSISAVVGLIALAGGYSVSGLAVHGAEALRSGALWALALLFVALYEELYFRGFPLYTLSRGLGFWPAAILLSLVFGAEHYFLKPQETWMDFLSVTLIGLFFCFTVRRTGDVWFAIGWHTTYNFGSLFVFGGPNTGNKGRPVPGHLLDSTFHGPDWLTGGPMGPEASAFIFLVIALLFWAFHRRFQEARYPLVGSGVRMA